MVHEGATINQRKAVKGRGGHKSYLLIFRKQFYWNILSATWVGRILYFLGNSKAMCIREHEDTQKKRKKTKILP